RLARALLPYTTLFRSVSGGPGSPGGAGVATLRGRGERGGAAVVHPRAGGRLPAGDQGRHLQVGTRGPSPLLRVPVRPRAPVSSRSEEHTSELQSRYDV